MFDYLKKRDLTTQFQLGAVPLETCDSYPYLGTVFSWNGSFKQAIDVLQAKASKAMYALLSKIFRFRNCDFKTATYLFDSMVKPILCYNCEVWGTFLLPNKKIDSMHSFTNLSNPLDSVQLKFLKHNLGLNKYATSWGTLSETGRKPIKLFVFRQMIKFWWHLKSSESEIIKAALSRNTALSETGYRCWSSHVSQILNWVSSEEILQETDDGEILKHLRKIKTKLFNAFLKSWQEHRQSIINDPSSKLHIIARVLTNKFTTATHINTLHDHRLRNCVSRFKLSAHNLPVETMRYLNIPRSLRLCPFCCSSIGDETHFFMECQYSDIAQSRTELFANAALAHIEPNLNGLISILRNPDPSVVLAVAKHIRTIEAVLKI